MAIRTVVTMGFGNGTFSGSVNLLPTLGYSIGQVSVSTSASLLFRGRKIGPLVKNGEKIGPLVKGQKVGPLFRNR